MPTNEECSKIKRFQGKAGPAFSREEKEKKFCDKIADEIGGNGRFGNACTWNNEHDDLPNWNDFATRNLTSGFLRNVIYLIAHLIYLGVYPSLGSLKGHGCRKSEDFLSLEILKVPFLGWLSEPLL